MTTAPDSASISAVVPTFNDAVRLGAALTSILNQTMPPAEVVVVDDGSDDGTEQLVGQFAERASSTAVRYIRLPKRSGVVAARNEGISAARGEWIACCDSDDMWAPTKLERQSAFIRDANGSRRIALLGSHGYNMNDAQRVLSPLAIGPSTEGAYDELKRRGGLFFVPHCSALFTRADFDAVGGYSTQYGWADDLDFFCRMAERGVVINMPEQLVYYRKRAGSVQLAHFWGQLEGLWHLAENQRRAAKGLGPIDREEFTAIQAAHPLSKRIKRRKWAWGMYYYRLGATHVVNGKRLRGGSELLLSSALDFARVRAGVRNALNSRLGRRQQETSESSLWE